MTHEAKMCTPVCQTLHVVIFFLFRWIEMPLKGSDKKNIKRLLSFPPAFFSKNNSTFRKQTLVFLIFWQKVPKISIFQLNYLKGENNDEHSGHYRHCHLTAWYRLQWYPFRTIYNVNFIAPRTTNFWEDKHNHYNGLPIKSVI